MKPPPVRVVVVGDELLSGRISDTNTTFLARELAGIGLAIAGTQAVPDCDAAIRAALRAARAGVVFVCGGLGPTPDDVTLGAVCRELRLRTRLDRGLLEKMRERFRRRGKPMPATARRQALVPRGATLLDNPAGMVPGIVIESGRRLFVLLPGVPQEFRSIVSSGVVPLLAKRFSLTAIPTLRVRTWGVPESRLAEKVAPLLRRFGAGRPAFYPSTRGVDLVLRAAAQAGVARLEAPLRRLLRESVYEVGNRSMAEVVGALLRERKQTLAIAESCTGGLVGEMLTEVAGSSDYYVGGVVTYSSELKLLLCGVRAATLERHGAVSAQVVTEMARGVRRLTGADWGVAVSGIAGPGGGTDAKPVGLVFVAVASGRGLVVERHVFNGDRRAVREQAGMAVLDLLRRGLGRKSEVRCQMSEVRKRRGTNR